MSARSQELNTTNPDTSGGKAVFRGTRVPVESQIWHLEKGVTIEPFLENIPSVSREQATGLLELVRTLLAPECIRKLY